MKSWPLIAAGAVLFALGFVVWFTAWIAWPIAVILVLIGIFAWARERRRASHQTPLT